MKKNFIMILIVVAIMSLLTGCAGRNSSAYEEAKQQNKVQQESNSQVGTPAITKFTEKRLLKQIYEMRDNNIPTYTYLINHMTGKPVFLIESIGYGIPASTQYNNPEQPYSANSGVTAIPMAEPNGLYSPAATHGTWVMIKDPNGQGVTPIFVEPDVIVSPVKLH